jgi:hypothetical protein
MLSFFQSGIVELCVSVLVSRSVAISITSIKEGWLR